MKPKKQPRSDPGIAWRRRILVALAAITPVVSHATTPSWWSEYGVTTGAPPADFSAINQGEAKNMAVAAVSELDTDLAQFGGAGPDLDAFAATLLSGTTAQTMDFAVLNRGTLKALAKPFYDRLLAVGYTGPPLYITGTSPTITGTYPWSAPGLPPPSDFGAANAGELKKLFSFDVLYSSISPGTGIPDWWLTHFYGGLTLSGSAIDPNAAVSWSGGQVTNLQAYQQGLNPIDFYNGQPATLTIVSGTGQIGPPNGFVPAPLVVCVTDTSGIPLYDAPVTFTVTTGTGLVQASSGGTPGSSVTILADLEGNAQTFFQLPNVANATSHITVTTGTGSIARSGTFAEFSDDGTYGPYVSPFSPTNMVSTLNSDGSVDMTWKNNTDDETAINVSIQLPDGSWSMPVSLPPHSTSYHFPPP